MALYLVAGISNRHDAAKVPSLPLILVQRSQARNHLVFVDVAKSHSLAEAIFKILLGKLLFIIGCVARHLLSVHRGSVLYV